MPDPLSKDAIAHLKRLTLLSEGPARETILALLADRDRLTRENAALREVAETAQSFRHVVDGYEDTIASVRLREALDAIDAWKASAHDEPHREAAREIGERT